MATAKSDFHFIGAEDYVFCLDLSQKKYVEFTPAEMNDAVRKACYNLYRSNNCKMRGCLNLFRTPSSTIYTTPLQKSDQNDLKYFVYFRWSSQEPTCKVLYVMTMRPDKIKTKCPDSRMYTELALGDMMNNSIRKKVKKKSQKR